MASGDGIYPRSEALNWTHGGHVNRYSLIREGRSWLSPPWKSKTPESDTGRISTSPTGAGVRRVVNGRIRDGRKRRRRAGPADSQTQRSLNSMEQFSGSSTCLLRL